MITIAKIAKIKPTQFVVLSFSLNTNTPIIVEPVIKLRLNMGKKTLLSKMGGEIVVAAIKNVPEKTDFYEALSEAGETLDVIKRSVELARSENTRIRPILRASRDVARGIIDVAEEEKCDLVVMGFPKLQGNGKPRILGKILKSSSTDVVILNLKMSIEPIKIEKVGIYLNRLRNLNLMLMCAAAVAERRGAKIIIFGFLPPGYTKKQKSKLDKIILAGLMTLKSTALYEVRLKISENNEEDIVRMSPEFDVLILGTGYTKNFEASMPFNVSRRAACTVLLVKTISRLRKLTKIL